MKTQIKLINQLKSLGISADWVETLLCLMKKL